MSRSLTLKLVLAFLLVSLITAGMGAVLARWLTEREFSQLVYDQAQRRFIQDVTYYYQINGSWQGVAEYLRRRLPFDQLQPQPQKQQPGLRQPQARDDNLSAQEPVPGLVFLLADPDGDILVPVGGYRRGDRLPDSLLAEATAIEVDGQVVGIAIATGETPPLDLREQNYLNRTNQALFYAGLAAALIALALAIFLARTLTRPLRELTGAIQAVSGGDLEQQVQVRSNDELGELAGAFNQMSADLARSNLARRQMTADIAHDLRTPLTVIAGYAEALRDGVLKPTPDRFETIHNEVIHLQRLVQDLRTLSLADAGELTLQRQPTLPGDLLERVGAAYQQAASQKGIDLQVQTHSGLPAVSVDPERIVQVLGNLVSNALRYTPHGGNILLSAGLDHQAVQFAVEDSGAGIDPGALAHIFDRFYRGDDARQGGESGLGLAIAKSLVEAHGGLISVKSELGQGTKFMVSLSTE